MAPQLGGAGGKGGSGSGGWRAAREALCRAAGCRARLPHGCAPPVSTVHTGEDAKRDLGWNFVKFLVDRSGRPIRRYAWGEPAPAGPRGAEGPCPPSSACVAAAPAAHLPTLLHRTPASPHPPPLVQTAQRRRLKRMCSGCWTSLPPTPSCEQPPAEDMGSESGRGHSAFPRGRPPPLLLLHIVGPLFSHRSSNRWQVQKRGKNSG